MLGPDDENALRLPDALAQIVVTQREWVDSVSNVFDAMERDQLGRIYNLPQRSIDKILDAGVVVPLVVRTRVTCPAVECPVRKGKGRAGGEAMDVDR